MFPSLQVDESLESTNSIIILHSPQTRGCPEVPPFESPDTRWACRLPVQEQKRPPARVAVLLTTDYLQLITVLPFALAPVDQVTESCGRAGHGVLVRVLLVALNLGAAGFVA